MLRAWQGALGDLPNRGTIAEPWPGRRGRPRVTQTAACAATGGSHWSDPMRGRLYSPAKALGAHVTAGQLALVLPAAIGAGGVAFAVKLLQFTQEHRAWLYALERATGLDLDGDGTTGEPPGAQAQPKPTIDGALVRGIDGSMHRLDVALSPLEMQAIKRHMLTAGAGVRAVTQSDETRASLLGQLTAWGSQQPKPRAAPPHWPGQAVIDAA